MKILGASKDTYIVEMTKDEAANYAGHYSAYEHERKWEVGTVLPMGDIYSKAQEAVNDFQVIKKSVDELHKASVRIITKLDISSKKEGN